MRVERPRRLALLLGAVLLLIATGSALAWSVTARRGDADDLLPNLVQAVPGELSGRTSATVAPKFFLGFDSAAANLGAGPLIVLGRRAGVEQPEMALRQQIRRSDGSVRTVPLRAALQYVRSLDHSHWHVKGFMRYELRTPDGVRVVRDRKTGFCLGDRYRAELALPGRSPDPRYSDRCGKGAPRLRSIREGISIGWGDNYLAHLEGQELEITSLAPGRYVLVHRVNPARDLRESDYTDNVASMAIELGWPTGGSSRPASTSSPAAQGPQRAPNRADVFAMAGSRAELLSCSDFAPSSFCGSAAGSGHSFGRRSSGGSGPTPGRVASRGCEQERPRREHDRGHRCRRPALSRRRG